MATKVAVAALLIILLGGCSRLSTQRLDTSGQPCASHADCRCRGFDGGKFLPYPKPSTCDFTTGRCVQCYYR